MSSIPVIVLCLKSIQLRLNPALVTVIRSVCLPAVKAKVLEVVIQFCQSPVDGTVSSFILITASTATEKPALPGKLDTLKSKL